MKKAIIFSFFIIVLASAPAFSTGFGLYGTGGYGRVDMLKSVDHGNDYKVKYSNDNLLYGGGLLLESGNEVEGYHNRFGIGVEGSKSFSGRYEFRHLMRLKIENVFAFRVAGNEQIRFWLGPLLGVNLLTGLSNTTRNNKWSDDKLKNHLIVLVWSPPASQAYGFYYIYLERVWKRTSGILIPIGLAMGINFKLAESATLTLEAGFRCGLYHLRNTGLNYEGYMNAGFIFGVI
jgi:hypothetical protein